MLITILIVVLILALLGSLPAGDYSASWGCGPISIVSIILIVVVVLALTHRL